MMTQLFTVYDSKAERFLKPFESETIATALRAFTELVNMSDHQFNRFPEDYTLYCIAQFDPETGKVDSYGTPQSIALASTLVQSQFAQPEVNGAT